jgi:hypothetical protein
MAHFLFALQELGDWEGQEMVRRDAYLSAEHLALQHDFRASHKKIKFAVVAAIINKLVQGNFSRVPNQYEQARYIVQIYSMEQAHVY